MDMHDYVSEVRALVSENRKLWPAMEEAGVVSKSYLAQFARGRYDNPGALTLQKIERFIKEKAAA